MDENTKRPKLPSIGRMVIIGIILGIFYWIIESIMDATVFRKGALVDRIFSPDPYEILLRSLAISTLLIFAIYSHVVEVSRRRTEENIQQRVHDLTLINSLNSAINRGDTLDEILNLLSQETSKVFDSHGVTVYLVSADRKYLAMQGQVLPSTIVNQVESLIGQEIPPVRIRLEPGSLYREILEEKHPRILNDPEAIRTMMAECTENERLKKLVPGVYAVLGIRSVIAVPLISGKQTVGLMELSRARPFTEPDMERITLLAGQLTAAIEHWQVVEKLREERDRTQAYLDTAGVIFMVVDAEGKVSLINQKGCEILGFNQEEIVGKVWIDNFLPADARGDVQTVFQTLMTGEVKPVEYFENPVLTKGGGKRIIAWHNTTLKDEAGNIVGALSSGEDITDVRYVEEMLWQRAAQLSLLNVVGSKIAAVLDLDSLLEKATQLIQESFGYHHAAIFAMNRERDELVMKTKAGSFADLYPADHRLKLGQGMVGWVGLYGETLLANDVDAEPRYVNLYPDILPTESELSVPLRVAGEIIGVLDVQSPQRDAFDDNDVMVIETLADQVAIAIENARLYEELQQELTERQRAEKKLEHYAAELERSNRELEHFAYIASHDLQEPLRMVTSYLQLLERRYRGKLDQDADDFIAYAVDGATRMHLLINDLLTYSRVSTRAKPFEPTNCSDILSHALSNLGVAIEESEATITFDDLPIVEADATQLTQVFQNLISNAIKFHKKDVPPCIHVSAERQEDGWRFSVRDNGIGIAAEHTERIFLIFQRLHTREEYPGTGIGLAVCKKIVERHNGRLWVESKPGEGSTFYFTIPDNTQNVSSQ
jgi:PAS domain S-box-containing protein